uniref:Uncharacterized protein n=1 Tax=Anguilla anguilla TaxID=7936 RepID=A0A0E9W5B3_ANGAN
MMCCLATSLSLLCDLQGFELIFQWSSSRGLHRYSNSTVK